jgi:ribosome-binding protein aMBF1 (putative translation factor)
MFRIARLLNRKELKAAIEPLQFPTLDTTHGWQSAKETWAVASVREQQIYTDAMAEFARARRTGYRMTMDEWSRTMWVWGCRVRRDILALELQMKELAKRLGVEDNVVFFDDPGDPPPPPDDDGLT